MNCISSKFLIDLIYYVTDLKQSAISRRKRSAIDLLSHGYNYRGFSFLRRSSFSRGSSCFRVFVFYGVSVFEGSSVFSLCFLYILKTLLTVARKYGMGLSL